MSYVREDISEFWDASNLINQAFALEGEVFRDVARRKTMRVQLGSKHYFVKLHMGVGWAEILKNWLQFKRPVLGAENEYFACRELEKAGIRAPIVAAYAMGDGSIASRSSFVLCDELANHISLEDVTEAWFDAPPSSTTRHRMLDAIARFAKEFHGRGFIHRDFYICHLLAEENALAEDRFDLAVLDLHRARKFEVVPDRWLYRDLGGLLFSTLDLGYSRRDWYRFVRLYSGRPLAVEFAERGAFWQRVLDRAETLYREGMRKGIVKGMYQADG